MSKFIAIDLDAQGVFVLSGAARGGGKIEHSIAWDGADGDAPPVLMPETAKRLGEQLRDRLKAAGVAPGMALVSVGRDRVILKELRYPTVPPTEEPNVVRFQALKELSDSPEDVILDYTPLSNGTPAGERRSMAVAIRKDLYAAIQTLCAGAHLKLAAVTPRPYAVAAGLARALAGGAIPALESKTDAVAVLTLGPGGGEFTVVRNGEVTFTRAVPGPVVSSEPMLLAEVRRNLTMYAGSNPEHPVAGLYVAEAGGGWSARLRAALGVPVHAYDPLAGADTGIPEPTRGRFAGAAGLLAAQAAGAVPINFTAPRQPRTEKDPKKAQILAAALAAILLFGVGAAFGYMKLDAKDDEIAVLRQRKSDLEQEVKESEADAKRLDAARKWQARRVVWLDELYDMADRFPTAGGFYATSFWGRALAPDSKTAKQSNQATIELKTTARSIEPVHALYYALNFEPKYYVGASTSTGGPASGDSAAREYTVFTRVNGRPAEQFTRTASFSAPVRKSYPPRGGAAASKRETPDPESWPDAEGETAVVPVPKDNEPAENQ